VLAEPSGISGLVDLAGGQRTRYRSGVGFRSDKLEAVAVEEHVGRHEAGAFVTIKG